MIKKKKKKSHYFKNSSSLLQSVSPLQHLNLSPPAASSGSFYISNEWWCTQKDLGARYWQLTVSVNQIKCLRRVPARRLQRQESFVHDEQRGSASQQLHRHHWTADLPLLKGKANINTTPGRALEKPKLSIRTGSLNIGRLTCIMSKTAEASQTHPQAAFSPAAASDWG